MSEMEGEDEEVVMVAGVMFEDVCVPTCVCVCVPVSEVQVLLQCQRKRQAQSGVG